MARWEVEASALTPSAPLLQPARATAESPARRQRPTANGHRADLAERSAAQSPTKPPTIVMEQITRVAKERAKGLTLDSNILEMSMDSLERMEIVAALEDTFGGRFPEEMLPDMITRPRRGRGRGKVSGQNAHVSARVATDRAKFRRENYRFDQFPEYMALKQQWQLLASTGAMNPYFKVHERVIDDTTHDRRPRAASVGPATTTWACRAIRRWPRPPRKPSTTTAPASRPAGWSPARSRSIANWNAPSPISSARKTPYVFVGGHATNETTIGHLFGPGDLILHDSLAHNSIVQGCILSGRAGGRFPHNDWQTLDQLLGELRHEYRRVLIAIEGVYSMDGDFPDLPQFIEVKKRHKAILMIDEAHSIGVMGPHGRGIGEHFDVEADGRRYLDGHAQQGVGQLRRIHRRRTSRWSSI